MKLLFIGFGRTGEKFDYWSIAPVRTLGRVEPALGLISNEDSVFGWIGFAYFDENFETRLEASGLQLVQSGCTVVDSWVQLADIKVLPTPKSETQLG